MAADVVLFTVAGQQLRLLLVRRAEHSARGRLALPGSFVRPDEGLDDIARRTLRDKVGVDAPVRQFASFGRVDAIRGCGS